MRSLPPTPLPPTLAPPPTLVPPTPPPTLTPLPLSSLPTTLVPPSAETLLCCASPPPKVGPTTPLSHPNSSARCGRTVRRRDGLQRVQRRQQPLHLPMMR